MSSSPAERAESPAPEPSLFVINLCASTTPMALVHPSNPELKRYTFFVTRQREDGRERFRLHMGYFASLFEAETLLGAVRDVYPAAWAGPAPTTGAPRRGRVASVVPPVAPPAPAAPVAPAIPEPGSAPAPKVELTLAPPPPPSASNIDSSLDAMSNVRDVLAQLSDDMPTRIMPAPESIPTLSESQTLHVLETPAAPAKPAPAPMPQAPAMRTPAPASTPRPVKQPAARGAAPLRTRGDEVRLVTPEDTQTLRDIRLDAERNAPPCFAVQLLWSVTPITITDHPHLAIFDAYTLYNVEGNRQGRKWYGLRLGFFSDPTAATQVAYYVRSDYPTVAVVPVAEKERENARGTAPTAVPARPAVPKLQDSGALQSENLAGFELLDDDQPAPAKRDVDDLPASVPTVQAAKKPAIAPAQSAGVKKPGKPTGKRVVVRRNAAGRVTPGASVPLEETLEILGASTLTLDESREVMNDTAVRAPVTQKKKAGRFSKLLNRLGGG